MCCQRGLDVWTLGICASLICGQRVWSVAMLRTDLKAICLARGCRIIGIHAAEWLLCNLISPLPLRQIFWTNGIMLGHCYSFLAFWKFPIAREGRDLSASLARERILGFWGEHLSVVIPRRLLPIAREVRIMGSVS